MAAINYCSRAVKIKKGKDKSWLVLMEHVTISNWATCLSKFVRNDDKIGVKIMKIPRNRNEHQLQL